MLVINGYEATKQIKSTTKSQVTVIIALTASTLEEERAVALSSGCDDFVRKPFREQIILDWLTQLHHAAKAVNAKQLLKLIDQLPPNQIPIVNALRTKINRFTFEEIVEMTAKALTHDIES